MMLNLFKSYYSSIDRGVIYVVTDDKLHVDNAIRSAESLKKYNNIHITLYTNRKMETADYTVFDNVTYIKNFNKEQFWVNRMRVMLNSPYHITLYLDADSYIVDSIDDVFHVMKKIDYAICHGGKKLARHYKAIRDGKIDDSIPYAFSPVNGGMQIIKKNYRTRKFLKEVIMKYLSNQYYDDQVSIREVLWNNNSNVKYYILPMEYHIGAKEFIELWDAGIYESQPKIFFHSQWNKGEQLESLLKYVDVCSQRISQKKNNYM